MVDSSNKYGQISEEKVREDILFPELFDIWDCKKMEDLVDQLLKTCDEGDVGKEYLKVAGSVVDPCLEWLDPKPDIEYLFRLFDNHFFNQNLKSLNIQLCWSDKMTRCAGLFGYSRRTRRIFIRLSRPLLGLRTRKDLVETLLHEMIHASVLIKKRNGEVVGRPHGKGFHQEMDRINASGQCNVTVYHHYHKEVQFHQTHAWRCSGPCRDVFPHYGWVKRAMNRSPKQQHPRRYPNHDATCGGTFVKIYEPIKKPQSKPQLKNLQVDHSYAQSSKYQK